MLKLRFAVDKKHVSSAHQDHELAVAFLYNSIVASDHLTQVLDQLKLYDHPLISFSARANGDGVQVILSPKFTEPKVHTYYYDLHPRDLDDPQFEWALQRQIFDCLHDYLVEMFIRTPQHRKENARMAREGKL